MARYSTILADPPWAFKNYSAKGESRNANRHYPTMSIEDIAALPIGDVAEKNCMLILWATWPHLENAMNCARGWGFGYVTGAYWRKLDQSGNLRIITGYQMRACSEPFLIFRRGRVPAPPPSKRPVGEIETAIHEHSAKPYEMYDRAELYPGPYLELFARPNPGLPRHGWTHVGGEISQRDIRDDLRILSAAESASGLFGAHHTPKG